MVIISPLENTNPRPYGHLFHLKIGYANQKRNHKEHTMSNKYSSDKKKLARRLLIMHGGDVNIVHQLTEIPKRTLYRWREEWDDAYDLYIDAMAQKVFDRASAKSLPQSHLNPDETEDEPLAQSENQLAQLTQLRHKLMEHVNTLTDNLMVMDGNINSRVYAISRLLDRILHLDTLIRTDPQQEHVVRFEYYYDGEVHDVPPWKGASEEKGYDYDTPLDDNPD